MEPIEETKALLNDFLQKYSSVLNEIHTTGEKLRDSCSKVKLSWSGSFAGWHGKMYYQNYSIPPAEHRFSVEWGELLDGLPEGWVEKQNDETLNKIEVLTGNGFSYKNFEQQIKILRAQANDLKREITINFSGFSFGPNTRNEELLFKKIENFKFGQTKEEFIQNEFPSSVGTRDSGALMQGLCLPSWLFYKGAALEGNSLVESVNGFLKLADQMLRQLEIKKTVPINKPIKTKKGTNNWFILFTFCFVLSVFFLIWDVVFMNKNLGPPEIVALVVFFGAAVISFIVGRN